jgi:hypothetical protein
VGRSGRRRALGTVAFAAVAGVAGLSTAVLPSHDDAPRARSEAAVEPLGKGWLEAELGPPGPAAPIVPSAGGVRVAVPTPGYRLESGVASLELTTLGVVAGGVWERHEQGATRALDVGRETIVASRGGAETFVTVDRRQGERVWRWLVRTNLEPTLDRGRIEWGGGTGFRTRAVRILDAVGRDVTPAGAGWSLSRARDGWEIRLRLDDARLPLPYTIDPATFASASSRTAVNTGCTPSSNTCINVTRPAGSSTNMLLLAHVSFTVSVGSASAVTITPTNGGWKLAGRTANGALVSALYYRVHTASEAASYTFTFNTTSIAGATAQVASYDLVDFSGERPYDALPVAATGSGTSVDAPSVTPSVSDGTLVTVFASSANAVFAAAPSGMNSRSNDADTTATSALVADDAVTSTAATGTRSATAGADAAWVAQSLVLRAHEVPTPYVRAVLDSSPAGYWRLNDEAVATGLNGAGALAGSQPLEAAGVNTVTFGQQGAPLNTATSHGIGLSGTTSAYLRSGSQSWTLGALEAWVQTSSSDSSFRTIVGNNSVDTSSATDAIMAMGVHSGALVGFRRGSPDVQSPGTIADGQWHHVVYTWGSDTGTLYVDGAQVATGSQPDSSSPTGRALRVGKGFYGSTETGLSFVGAIDEVAVYSGALSSATVAAHYARARDAAISFSATTAASPSSATGAIPSLWYQASTSSAATVTVGGAKAVDSTLTNVAFGGFTGATVGSSTRNVTPSGSPLAASAAYSWNTSGTKTISVVQTAAGGTDTSQFTLQVDSTPPTGTPTVAIDTAATGSNGWYTGNGSVQIAVSGAQGTAADAESGLAAGVTLQYQRYTSDCATLQLDWTTFSSPLTISTSGCYLFRSVVADNVGNTTSSGTATARVDLVAPGVSLALSETSDPNGNQAVSGTTVFYKPGAAGATFRVTATPSDAESGPAGVVFLAVTGLTGGGLSDTSSPYTADYSWDDAFAGSGSSGVARAIDTAGNESAASGVTFTADTTPPTGGSVTATGLTNGYRTTASIPLTIAEGIDSSGSGVASWSVARASQTMATPNTCTLDNSATFSAIGGANPASFTDSTGIASGNCYRYRLRVTDGVGNTSDYFSGSVKVDTTAPTSPTLTASGLTNAFWNAASSRLYVKGGAGSGTATLTAAATDAQSGIQGYSFPDLNSGVGNGFGGSQTTDRFDWTSTSPTAPVGTQDVTAVNNAGLTAFTSFTVLVDSTAPTGGSVTVAAYRTALSIPVTIAEGSDGESGIASWTLARASQTLPAVNSCTLDAASTFSAIPGVAASPASFTDSQSIASGSCYRYRLRVVDNVGNTTDYFSGNVIVDVTAPSTPTLVASGLSNAFWNGSASTLYVRGGAGGTATLTASSTDDETGVASYSFPDLNAGAGDGFGGSQTGDRYDYTFASPTAPSGAQNVTATNNASLTAQAGFSVTVDGNSPSGGSVSYSDTVTGNTTATIGLDFGSDASGIAIATLRRLRANYDGTTCGSYALDATRNVLGAGSAVSETGLTAGRCYTWELVVTDNVGNPATTYTSANQYRISPPALAVPDVAGDAKFQSATTLYVSPSGGTFRITVDTSVVTDATSADFDIGPGSGLAGGGNQTGLNPNPLASELYTWTGAFTGSATLNVVIHRSGHSDLSQSLTVQLDGTAPTGTPSLATDGTPVNGFVTDPNGDVSFAGSDAGSGVAQSVLKRLRAPYVDGGAGVARVCDSTYSQVSSQTNPGSPAAVAASSEGCFKWAVQYTDNVGNTSSEIQTAATMLYDATPPVLELATTATAGAAHVFATGLVTNALTVYYNPAATSPVFEIAGASDTGSGVRRLEFPAVTDPTFTCPAVNGSVWTCTVTSGNGTAPAQQSVTARDWADRTSTGSVTFVRDVAAPATSDDTASIGNAWRSVATTVTLSPSDGASGVGPTYYTADGSAPTTASATGTSVTLATEGTHTVRYFSVDRVDNAEAPKTAGTVIRLDLTPPTSTIGLLPAAIRNGQALSGSGTDARSGISGSAVTYLYCAGSSCTPSTLIGTSTSGGSVTWSSQPSDGTYTVAARVTDNAGNSTLSATQQVAIDNSVPNAVVSVSTASPTNAASTSVTFAASDANALASPLRQVRAGAFDCTGFGSFTTVTGTTGTPASATATYTFPGTSNCYEFRYQVTDAAGNSGTATRQVRVDRVPPAAFTIAGVTSGADVRGAVALSASPTDSPSGVVSVAFAAHDGSVTVPIAVVSGSAPYTTSWQTGDLNGFPDGVYTVTATATDAAGNTRVSSVTDVEVDHLAPQLPSITSSPADGDTSGSATFSFTGEPGATFRCSLDDALTLGGCTSPATYSSLAVGTHTFRVLQVDGAGNEGPVASHTWTAAAPAAPRLTSSPPASTTEGAATFAFVSDDGFTNFGCSLDGAAFAACSSPVTLTGIAVGAHTFSVRVRTPGPGIARSFTWEVTAPVLVAPPGAIVAPALASASPADGATVAAVGPTISFTATKAVAFGSIRFTAPPGAPPAPTFVVNGATASAAYSSSTPGLYTFSADLADGITTPVRVTASFTISGGTPAARATIVAGAAGSLAAGDGAATVSWPALAFPLVLTLASVTAPAGAVPAGFAPGTRTVSVEARAVGDGASVTDFGRQWLDIVFEGVPLSEVPAYSRDGGATWTPILALRSASLPATAQDGWYRDALGRMHVLTRHLTLFTLLRDTAAPATPILRGKIVGGRLVLRWTAAADASGIAQYRIVVGRKIVRVVAGNKRIANVGAFGPRGDRAFQVQALDRGGNGSALSNRLVSLPSLIGLTVAQARAVVQERGLALGPIAGPRGARIARQVPGAPNVAAEGTAIAVTTALARATLAFRAAPADAPTPDVVAVRVRTTAPVRIVATLTRRGRPTGYSGTFHAPSGTTILWLRPQAPEPGAYVVVLRATSTDRQAVVRRVAVRVPPSSPARR